MACGKTWTGRERQCAVRAYILATTNAVVGCNQTSDNFAASIHYNLKKIQPLNVDVGNYSEQTPKNI